MKYLNKDWYNKMQCSDLHILLKIDKRANEFSEKFYQKLYKKAKKDYIKTETYLSSYKKFKRFILENNDSLENLNEDTIKEKYEKHKKQMFNGMSVTEAFDNIQNNIIEELKQKLPKVILDEIKDIRVLALNYVSNDIYEKIKKYSEKNEQYVKDKAKEYNKLEKETFKNNKLEFIKESFHDCYVLKCKKNKKDLEIKLDNENEFTDKDYINFKNCNIKLDEKIENTRWICNEIYIVDNKYEIHILTTNENDLKELILTCDDIEVK